MFARSIRCRLCCVFVLSLSAATTCVAASPSKHFPERLLPLIDQLETTLRITYHLDPPIHHARVESTLQVVAAWQRSTRTPRDEALLKGWLHDAIDRSLPGRRTELAPIPLFSKRGQPAFAPQATPPATAVVEKVATKESTNLTQVTPKEPTTVVEPRASTPGKRTEPSAPALLQPARTKPIVALDRHDLDIAVAAVEPAELESPTADKSDASEDSPVASEVASDGVDVHATTVKPAPIQVARTTRESSPTEPRPIPDENAQSKPTSHAASPVSLTEPPPSTPPKRISQPIESPKRHPSPIDASQSDNPPLESLAPVLSFSSSVQIDLRQLQAQLAGHRRGVRRLEARLFELDTPSPRQLAGLAGELNRLRSLENLLSLYNRILSPEMRTSYGLPGSTDHAQAMLKQILQERIQAATGDREKRHLGQLLEQVDVETAD